MCGPPAYTLKDGYELSYLLWFSVHHLCLDVNLRCRKHTLSNMILFFFRHKQEKFMYNRCRRQGPRALLQILSFKICLG